MRQTMTEVWAIRIIQVNHPCLQGPPGSIPPASAQAIVAADQDTDSWPPMPKHEVLEKLIADGLGKHHGHNLSSLKRWIMRNK